jgi:signal transduction histidine kinase/ActR/RegA family two-component response regulator
MTEIQEFLRYANIFPEPILLIDSGGVVLAANKRASEELASLPINIGETSLFDIASADAGRFRDYLRLCSRTNKFLPGSVTLASPPTPETVYRTEAALYAPKSSNSAALLLLRLTPKIPAKGSFVALNQKISQLSREIVGRRKAEDEAITQREKFEELNRHKDEFLAMLGHELRNPLAPIKSATRILALQKGTDESQSRALAIIDRQVSHLTRIVDELLDAARVSTGSVNLKFETIEVATIILRALELSETMIQQKQHQLRVKQPSKGLYVKGDLQRLTQVLANILNNAAKYTEPSGAIEVEVLDAGARVEIAVKDNGMGVHSTFLPHIFDLFTQSDKALDRAQGGLGIGLTVVKQLVEKHDGTVTVFSDGPGRGSEFRVSLPLVAPPLVQSVPPTVSTPKDSGRRKILVVDDNLDALSLMSEFLSLIGNDVITASNGNEAISAALCALPTVIILDIGLPQLDGYEVAKRLRAVPELRSVLLIALTGYGQSEDRVRAREAGFDLHLVKPVDLDEINRLIVLFEDNQSKLVSAEI